MHVNRQKFVNPAFRGEAAHKWRKAQEGWQCVKCLEISFENKTKRPSGPCHRNHICVKAMDARKGHILRRYDSELGPFLTCIRCGAYAHSTCRELGNKCGGTYRAQSTTGAGYLKRLEKRWHPSRSAWAWPVNESFFSI